MASTKELRQFWDSRADVWKNHAEFADAERGVTAYIQKMVALVSEALPPSPVVLNLGSGADNYIENQIDSTNLYSIDLSAEMLHRNSSHHKAQADMSQPVPIPDARVDLCTSFFLTRYLSDRGQLRLMEEIGRLLKSGGWFLIVDVPYNYYPHQISKFDAYSLAQSLDEYTFPVVVPREDEISYERYDFEWGTAPVALAFDIQSIYGQKTGGNGRIYRPIKRPFRVAGF